MSIILATNEGWVISHSNYIKKIYENILNKNKQCSLQLRKELFQILTPFWRYNQNINKYNDSAVKKKRKYKEYDDKYQELITTVEHVNKLYEKVIKNDEYRLIFPAHLEQILHNKEAMQLAEKCCNESKHEFDGFGASDCQTTIQQISNQNYLFPKNAKFYCKNITEINKYLANDKFDVILLDPPWWNKFVRRKKAKSNQGYEMMYNVNLNIIPISDLLNTDGLVVVWCTNSPQHFEELVNKIFPIWEVQKVAVWYWVKVTCSGETICKFSEPPKKQPFEQIIFARKLKSTSIPVPNNKIVISIPSAISSHKPPLTDLLAPYIREDSKCLEIFARYLIPGWTSWGLEAIKLQHESLYE